MNRDKFIDDLHERIEEIESTAAEGDSSIDNNDDSYGLCKHDDEYYLDRGLTPRRITYYRHARWEKLDEQRN